jgi:folate-binding protein YgfZ
MKTTPIYTLEALSILDIDGQDTAAILHNLTTNEVKNLVYRSANDEGSTGTGCETFITDVRGKTLGHVCAYRTSTGIRLIGAGGQSETIAAHADKYTIREDAVPVSKDTVLSAFSMDRNMFSMLQDAMRDSVCLGKIPSDNQADLQSYVDSLNSVSIYENSWLGDRSILVLVPAETKSQWIERFTNASADVSDEDAFHTARTVAGFPWFGIDLTDKNLPQEADRDEVAISFTKGCYLGQETVARLDALGQVQKKLVCWSIDANNVTAGSELTADGKLVGRLTSVASVATDQCVAIGVARRSHFDPGSTATGTSASGDFTATVL